MGMGGAGVHAYALTPRTWLQIWAVQLKIVPKLGSSTRATHAALKSASGEPHVQYNLKQRVRGIGDVSPTQESRTIQTISQKVLVTVATTTSRRTRRSATSTSLNSFRLPSTRSVACTRIRHSAKLLHNAFIKHRLHSTKELLSSRNALWRWVGRAFHASVSTAVLRACRVPACATHRFVRMSRAMAA